MLTRDLSAVANLLTADLSAGNIARVRARSYLRNGSVDGIAAECGSEFRVSAHHGIWYQCALSSHQCAMCPRVDDAL